MKMRMSVSSVVKKINEIAKNFPDRVANAIHEEALIEVKEMQKRCPVDTRADAPHPGQLRDSIHAEQPVRDGRNISVTIATTPEVHYALYVHEDLDAYHPIGQAKFMESVLNESQPHMANRVAARLHFDKGHK